MSPNKSHISTEESSAYSYPASEIASEAPPQTKSAKKTPTLSDLKDTVQEFREELASLSSTSGNKHYDSPIQAPSLVPPIEVVQKTLNASAVTEATLSPQPAQTQTKVFFKNIEEVFNGLEGAIDKVIQDSALSENPEVKEKMSFMRKISEAIQDLKRALQEINLADALCSEKLTKEKFDQLQARIDRLEQLIIVEQKRQAERKKGEAINEIMKILSPILIALTTVIGAVLSVVTFGAGLPLVLAGVAIGAAFLTLSIVESATGTNITGKVVEAFNKAVKELLPDSPDWVRTLVKTLTVVVVVAVLAVVAWAASGAVAANVAGKSALELAKTFGAESLKQLAIQLIPMTILASNAIPEMVANILKASGMSEKDQRIAEVVMMIIQILTVILAMVFSGKTGAKVKTPKTNLSTFGATMRYFSRAGGNFMNLGRGCAQLMIGKKTGLSPDQFNNLIETIRALGTNLLTTVNKLVDLTNIGAQAVTNVILGICKLEEAKLLNQVGDLKSTEELIQEMIRQLEKILSSLQTQMSNRSDFLDKIQQALAKFYEELNQNTNRLLRPVQG